MGQGRNVNDRSYIKAYILQCSDGRLPTRTGPFYKDLNLSKSEIIRHLATILRGHLRCIRRVLFRTPESHLTRRCPRNYLTCRIGDGNNDVVEGSLDMRLAYRLYFNNPL